MNIWTTPYHLGETEYRVPYKLLAVSWLLILRTVAVKAQSLYMA